MCRNPLCAVKARLKFFRSAALLYKGADAVGYAGAAAGFDLRADLDEETLDIRPGERALVPSGLAVEPLEEGVAAFIYSRSGLGGLKGLVVAQGVGVIDPDYRGEIKIPLLNSGAEVITLRRGDRVAQMIFQPFFRAEFQEAEELGETARGAGGFGHTGMS